MQDELLNEFINESREHLATIEADLLAIEEGGANVDETLVNKVFRAAHSLKGGSGFLGLNKVKDLAHKAETVLDMLRSRKIIPNAEVTNILLAAFDRLRGMINAPAESDAVDTEDLLLSLTNLASSYLEPEQKGSLTRQDALQPSGFDQPILVPQVDVDRARRSGQCIYCVDYDLIHDVERKGLNLLQVFRDLGETGEVLDCFTNFDAVGNLDGDVGNQLPLRLVLATSLAPHLMPELLGVAESKVHLLFDPYHPVPSLPPPCPATPEPTPVVTPIPKASPAVSPSLPPPPSRDVGGAHAALPSAPPPETFSQVAAPTPVRRTDPSAAPGPVTTPSGAPDKDTSPTPAGAGADETLRVNVGLLETLMNLAGELVLSRNQLRSAVAHNDQQALQVADQRLNQVTSDLQDAIMRTRLQPVGNVFGKFPRLVRDLSNSLRKEIVLDVRGKDVALDRSLIEGLSDPLTHLVRNAVDHGIEAPGDRIRVGKKATGNIRIEARHEAGQVVVEIADDGRGIQAQKVADSAVAKGLIPEEKVRAMSEQEKIALIFLPGLSTADKVTDVSGRGVGMDVVKTNLDRLGGQADIESKVGQGTTIRIKLPLTLAIIPSLIVSVGHARLAIPQVNVEELLRIRPDDASKRIEVVGQTEVLLLRDRIMPLLRLGAFLGAESPTVPSEHAGGTEPDFLEIAVVTTGPLQYGIVVGSFHDTEEIVVKPMGRHLKGLREYAGATILGDGTVALILDVGGLAAKAELGNVVDARNRAAQAEEAERNRLENVHPMLVFHNAPNEVCATPLDTVLRIERITPEQVETLGSRRTMKYRGGSLPLVTLSDVARVDSLGDSRDLAVIVSSVRGREVGLLGAMPVDVVESRDTIDQSTHRQPGIAGSAIIRDRTTLIADVFELVDAVYPEWNTRAAAANGSTGTTDLPPSELASSAAGLSEVLPPSSASPTVLLAEDSDFFRAQIRKYLEQDGYRVLDAPDGEAAWEVLANNADAISAVVTDIEMPRLTGLGLARRIRSDDRFARLPIIALTSLAGDDDIAAGKAAGIDDYQVKLDRERLISGLRSLAQAA